MRQRENAERRKKKGLKIIFYRVVLTVGQVSRYEIYGGVIFLMTEHVRDMCPRNCFIDIYTDRYIGIRAMREE